LQDGDRGIQCANACKTITPPGLTYGIFVSFSRISVGYTYPVFYTYNSLTSSFTSDYRTFGSSNVGIGPSVLTGSVYQGNGFGNRMANEEQKPMASGTPLGGIIVKGGKNPDGQMFVQT
jgi:hypothetical protein